ncbi:MAG TPA: von Willebrand factor type A domain-containing protein [Ilumatobacter sp.]|nr:von Willebrand factor type A domain-containing protein [Ilumatobacter sp.]
MRGRRRAALAGLLIAAMVLGACGGDDDSSTESNEANDVFGETQRQSDAEFDSDPDSYPNTSPVLDDASAATVAASANDESSNDVLVSGTPANQTPANQSTANQTTANESADRTAASEAPDGADSEGIFVDEPAPPSPNDPAFNEDNFVDYGQRVFVDTNEDPLSTFALDVDTGSFSIARRSIDEGSLPPAASVRPEEYINAIRYDYESPRKGLDVTIDGAPSPFDDDNMLVRVGVSSEEVADGERPPVALTFVIDTSGSMDEPDRLGLVEESLEILVDALDDDDTVAIVTYSDSSGVVLYPTPISERNEILDAIDDLSPGGSTNLESGLREGYGLAREAFRQDGINRVIVASDGLANAGVTAVGDLAEMVASDADRGINLVTVGYGMGDYGDETMEQLANKGDGFYAYIDTEDEAERLFEDELTSTLITVAKNAKIQVEFDPEIVASYRLIGYENRAVHDSDFRNDDVDAGEIGAGHQVTAIYEVELRPGVSVDDRGRIGEVFLRWEDPASEANEPLVTEIDEDIDLRDVAASWRDTSDSLQLATVMAGFAEIMRGSEFVTDFDLDDLADAADDLADRSDDRAVHDLADLLADATRLD